MVKWTMIIRIKKPVDHHGKMNCWPSWTVWLWSGRLKDAYQLSYEGNLLTVRIKGNVMITGSHHIRVSRWPLINNPAFVHIYLLVLWFVCLFINRNGKNVSIVFTFNLFNVIIFTGRCSKTIDSINQKKIGIHPHSKKVIFMSCAFCTIMFICHKYIIVCYILMVKTWCYR